MKPLLSLLTLVTALALLPFAATAQNPMSDAAPALVTVTGEHRESFVPDEVRFSFSVQTEGEDLLAAKKDNQATVSEILAYLKEAGIPSKDIQTRYLNVYTQYRDAQRVRPRYTADQSISVVLRDVTRFDEVNTGLLQRGVTGLNGPNFGYSKLEEARDAARLAAVKDAREKAEALAAALGQRIGPAYSINDVQGRGAQPRMLEARAMSMDAGEPGIAVGESEIGHSVVVAFYLYAE